MWGSYVGAIVGFILLFMIHSENIINAINRNAWFEAVMSGGCVLDTITGHTLCSDMIVFPVVKYLPYIFIGLISGFLVGWGIHSLVRAWRS